MLREGTLITSHLRLISQLAQGAAGELWLAKNLLLDRDVAVKVLRSELEIEPKRVERFLREAKMLSKVNHTNVVRVFSTGLDLSGRPYIEMELLQGETLRQRLDRGRLGKDVISRFFAETLDGLAAIHEVGLVHGDLSPANLFLERLAADSFRVKILDFGLTKVGSLEKGGSGKVASQTSSLFGIVGTPAYMSPESCKTSAIGNTADLYSAACIFYECLIGRPPLLGNTGAETMLLKIMESPVGITVQLRSIGLPTALSVVLTKALSRLPQERYQSAFEFKEELNRAFQQVESRPKVNMGHLGLLIFVTLTGLGFAFFQSKQQLETQSKQIVRLSRSERKRELRKCLDRIQVYVQQTMDGNFNISKSVAAQAQLALKYLDESDPGDWLNIGFMYEHLANAEPDQKKRLSLLKVSARFFNSAADWDKLAKVELVISSIYEDFGQYEQAKAVLFGMRKRMEAPEANRDDLTYATLLAHLVAVEAHHGQLRASQEDLASLAQILEQILSYEVRLAKTDGKQTRKRLARLVYPYTHCLELVGKASLNLSPDQSPAFFAGLAKLCKLNYLLAYRCSLNGKVLNNLGPQADNLVAKMQTRLLRLPTRDQKPIQIDLDEVYALRANLKETAEEAADKIQSAKDSRE